MDGRKWTKHGGGVDDAGAAFGGGLLFCHSRFHDLNDVPSEQRRRHEFRRDGRLVGVLDGIVSDGVFLSGHSAPFGGVDLVRDDPPVGDVVDLVGSALAALRDEGVHTVRCAAGRPSTPPPSRWLSTRCCTPARRSSTATSTSSSTSVRWVPTATRSRC